ncbi:hypothetical protein EPUS_04515 [Endocarpon pusillum Z07020]|uniref:Aminoglycoside phosphotransferase domain-containing protein n=1 Tax=Endocarpon pusillum (strain Z07020 / HMAS-L-300199) TaxID=1263415 RepID=U1GA22_ENDPU|nr:uncharacterized protein EPUS_04515 [Endocarpon pusillum Z07020]ERF68863.1 hypothetical protein EPUS_04515 [Endocarpon pusillum Z07020]
MEEKFKGLMVGEPSTLAEEQSKDSAVDESKNSSKEKSKNLSKEKSKDSTEEQPDDSADNSDSPIGSHSTTPNSTSTYEYSHEPFLSFQHKIVELAGQMGASNISDVMRLKGGSSNRVISATICCANESAPQIRGVFRIPRFTIWPDDEKAVTEPYELDRRIYEQLALWSLLAAHGVPAPRILAFDATAANAIHSPYTFQELANGTRLDEVYEKMSLDGKLSIVDELVRLLDHCESIKFSEAGRIDCVKGPNDQQTILPNRVGLFGHQRSGETATAAEIIGFGTGGEPRVPTRPVRDLRDLLKTQLDAWITYEIESAPVPKNRFTWNLFRRLQDVMQEMEALGFFEADLPFEKGMKEPRNILYHWDLEPRNILITPGFETGVIKDVQRWRISAVLDWDDSLILPPILSRKPPIWLWDFSDLDAEINSFVPKDYDGDVDLLPADRYGENSGRLSEDDRRIKTYFEANFVRALSLKNPHLDMAVYHDEAYGRGQWLRRLARFALDGFEDNRDAQRFDRFVEDWNRARPTFQTSGI